MKKHKKKYNYEKTCDEHQNQRGMGGRCSNVHVETWNDRKKDLGRALQKYKMNTNKQKTNTKKHKRTKKNQHKVHKNQQGVGWGGCCINTRQITWKNSRSTQRSTREGVQMF